jgi:hypothetical protein
MVMNFTTDDLREGAVLVLDERIKLTRWINVPESRLMRMSDVKATHSR